MLFHGFRSAVKLDMTLLHNSVFDTNNICSAVFTLGINRLHSFKRQPFWFHNLNSMVPVKGTVLFNLVFLSHLLFSIHIAFGKCKYCSLVFLFFLLILDL